MSELSRLQELVLAVHESNLRQNELAADRYRLEERATEYESNAHRLKVNLLDEARGHPEVLSLTPAAPRPAFRVVDVGSRRFVISVKGGTTDDVVTEVSIETAEPIPVVVPAAVPFFESAEAEQKLDEVLARLRNSMRGTRWRVSERPEYRPIDPEQGLDGKLYNRREFTGRVTVTIEYESDKLKALNQANRNE